MTRFANLSPKIRRDKVHTALEGVVRQLLDPTPTGEIVARVAAFLGLDKAEQFLAARVIVELSRTHPQSRLTGETFQKYGRTMQRREWVPLGQAAHEKLGVSEEEFKRKVAAQLKDDAAAEDADWTITPPNGGYLED